MEIEEVNSPIPKSKIEPDHKGDPQLEFVTDKHRHLVCVPYSIPNLHKMAEILDIKRCWFHRDHYDIPKRRIAEIEQKCTIVTPRDIVRIISERG